MGWLGWVARPWYFITGCLSAIPHLGSWRKARREMKAFKRTLQNPNDVSIGCRSRGINWQQDPKVLGVTIEWARFAWVTWTITYGDCEDLMILAQWLLSDLIDPQLMERWALGDAHGNFHAVLVFPYNGGYGLMSNLNFTIHTTKEAALRHFYGDRHATARRM